MISGNTIGRSKEEMKLINLDKPVDPFNYMLTNYLPVSILMNMYVIYILKLNLLIYLNILSIKSIIIIKKKTHYFS